MMQEARYFTIKQFNRIASDMAHANIKYRKNIKLVNKAFRKQIMLAVSKVNGCRVCSYVHTKSLIKSGAKEEELRVFLEGDFTNLSKDISLALIFAQHYADECGNYDKEAFDKLITNYGKDYAYGIMATIKTIMFGNVNGIALTNLVNRLRFRKPKNSKFLTDLYNGLIAYILLPIFFIINLFKKKKEF